MPNINDPVIYVNRDITKRVEGLLIFGDFTNRMLNFLLRSQFMSTDLALHPVSVVALTCQIMSGWIKLLTEDPFTAGVDTHVMEDLEQISGAMCCSYDG